MWGSPASRPVTVTKLVGGEIETRLVPELLAVHALLLGADAEILGRISEWLDRAQTQLLSDAEFLKDMGRMLDPYGSALLDENSGLLSVEAEASRVFTGYLWEVAPLASGPSLEL